MRDIQRTPGYCKQVKEWDAQHAWSGDVFCALETELGRREDLAGLQWFMLPSGERMHVLPSPPIRHRYIVSVTFKLPRNDVRELVLARIHDRGATPGTRPVSRPFDRTT